MISTRGLGRSAFLLGYTLSANLVELKQNQPSGVDVTEEYVAGGDRFWGDGANYLEDISYGCIGEPTADELDQMELDPEVASANEFLVESALSEGLTVLAGADDKDRALHAKATEVADAWERALKRIDPKSFLTQMLAGAIPTGHKVAETTWQLVEDREDVDYGQLTLKRCAVKPRNAARFVVDKYWNLLGIYAGPVAGTESGYRVLPVDKFAILTLHKRDEDPRGRSLDRAARTAWFLKTRIPPQYHRFLDSLILPFFIAKTAPGAEKRPEQETQPDGSKKKISKAQKLLNEVVKLKSMFAIAVEHGSEVDVEWNEGTGDAFPTAYSTLNREIRKAILLQELATSEGAHQARAASETHMSVLDYRVQSIRAAMAAMLDRLAYLFTLYNYGAKAANTYAPVHSLGDSDRRQWTEEMNAISKGWTAGWLKLANIEKLFAFVGIDLSDDWRARFERMSAAPTPGQPGAPAEGDDERPEPGKASAKTFAAGRGPAAPSTWLRRAA